MKIAYFDCFAGASGDMILGALINAGCDASYIEQQLNKLDLPDIKLKIRKVKKHSLAGIKVDFEFATEDHHHRSLSTIEKLIKTADFSDLVKKDAIKVFRRIGVAEAKMHDMPLEDVHFHEVGAYDSICDIVGACIGLEALEIGQLYSSPIILGSGVIDSAHGKIPIPSPATAEIVKGFPVKRIDSNAELTTPTGAAILSTLAKPISNYETTIEKIGYGAGAQDLDFAPNLLRLIIGQTKSSDFLYDRVAIIETNIDDSTPAEIGYLQKLLFSTGALDVFIIPIQMKKNRPGFLLSVIADPLQTEKLAEIILRESSSAGVRIREEQRRKLVVSFKNVETIYGKIRIKFYSGGEISKFAPEYESVIEAAEKTQATFSDVYRSAIIAAEKIKE